MAVGQNMKLERKRVAGWRESFFFPPQLVRAVGRQEERVRRGGGRKKTPKSIHCHGGAAHGAKTLVCDANTDASTLLLRKMWPARKTKTTTTKKDVVKKSPRGSVRGGKISSEQKQKSPPRPARCSQSSGRKRSSVPKGWISVRRLPGKQGVESHGSLDRGCLTVYAGNN